MTPEELEAAAEGLMPRPGDALHVALTRLQAVVHLRAAAMYLRLSKEPV